MADQPGSPPTAPPLRPGGAAGFASGSAAAAAAAPLGAPFAAAAGFPRRGEAVRLKREPEGGAREAEAGEDAGDDARPAPAPAAALARPEAPGRALAQSAGAGNGGIAAVVGEEEEEGGGGLEAARNGDPAVGPRLGDGADGPAGPPAGQLGEYQVDAAGRSYDYAAGYRHAPQYDHEQHRQQLERTQQEQGQAQRQWQQQQQQLLLHAHNQQRHHARAEQAAAAHPPANHHHAAHVGAQSNAAHAEFLHNFWTERMNEAHNYVYDSKSHPLPLARIKRVMKTDPEVKQMISAEAPMLFSRACEIFITELTTRARLHADEYKRRTLQRSDVAGAIGRSDQFDFLIDIVPREEQQKARRRNEETEQPTAAVQYYYPQYATTTDPAAATAAYYQQIQQLQQYQQYAAAAQQQHQQQHQHSAVAGFVLGGQAFTAAAVPQFPAIAGQAPQYAVQAAAAMPVAAVPAQQWHPPSSGELSSSE